MNPGDGGFWHSPGMPPARARRPRRGRHWVVALVVVVAIGVGGGGWVLTRDEGQPLASGRHIRTELLDQARPRPTCPNAPAAAPVQVGQTLLSILRVVDHCLAYGSEAVPSSDVQRRLAALRADPGVVAADVPTTFEPASTTTSKPVKQWALDDLRADEVRKLWPAGADVKVAIVDTGIDDTNPDLAGQVVDKAPWAHVFRGDDDLHGTHVAGIVAAKDDGDGALGLTPAVKLLDVQYRDADGWAGPSEDIGEYLRWAIDHGADVINMSFGGAELADTTVAALLYAERSGVVAVASGGNCGEVWPIYKVQRCASRNEIQYPAAYDATVLSVASYDRHHDHSGFSTVNGSVDLAAPGGDIESTCLARGRPDRVTCKESGTSMAAPYVAAAAALLRARHPEATPTAIREALMRSTRPVENRPSGVRSDDFGTGMLDPAAAAAYLDQHAGGTISRSGSPGATSPDTVVAGYVAGSRAVKLVTAGGTVIPVSGLEPGERAPRIAFSRDGAWFAAVDRKHLTVVNVQSLRQETATCACAGVAFTDKGQVVTGDGDVIAYYEPATASRLGGVRLRNSSGTGGPLTPLSVEGSSGDVTVIGAQFASGGYGAFGVRVDGRTFLIGQGPDPGVSQIALSDDGRWVAWSMRGVCLGHSMLGVADLRRPGSASVVTGPLADGEALQIRFDGDTLVAGWAPMQHQGGGCGEPAWPPVQWRAQRPPMGKGTYLAPSGGNWTKTSDPRRIVRRMPSGELLYTQAEPTEGNYELWFGPAPGGASPVQLSSDITDVAARPL